MGDRHRLYRRDKRLPGEAAHDRPAAGHPAVQPAADRPAGPGLRAAAASARLRRLPAGPVRLRGHPPGHHHPLAGSFRAWRDGARAECAQHHPGAGQLRPALGRRDRRTGRHSAAGDADVDGGRRHSGAGRAAGVRQDPGPDRGRRRRRRRGRVGRLRSTSEGPDTKSGDGSDGKAVLASAAAPSAESEPNESPAESTPAPETGAPVVTTPSNPGPTSDPENEDENGRLLPPATRAVAAARRTPVVRATVAGTAAARATEARPAAVPAPPAAVRPAETTTPGATPAAVTTTAVRRAPAGRRRAVTGIQVRARVPARTQTRSDRSGTMTRAG